MDLFCLTKWGDESIEIFFPVIPLSGEPYNVNFDYSATNAKVKYNTSEWQTVSASINGWIKAYRKRASQCGFALFYFLSYNSRIFTLRNQTV